MLSMVMVQKKHGDNPNIQVGILNKNIGLMK